MNHIKLLRRLNEQEMLLRSYVGFCDSEYKQAKIWGEIYRLVYQQKSIRKNTPVENLKKEVYVPFEIKESRMNWE